MDKYPLLYNDGNVVWIDRWYDETLREMPRLIVHRYRPRPLSLDHFALRVHYVPPLHMVFG